MKRGLMHRLSKYSLFIGFFLVFRVMVISQATPSAKSPSSATTPAAPTSTSSLAGLSWAQGDWQKQMPTGKNLVMLCYALKKAQSASLPFTLEPIGQTKPDSDKKTPACVTVDAKHPLLQRQAVVVVIDATDAGQGLSRVKVLNINLTATTVPPLNVAPLRPSIGTSDATTVQNAVANTVFYFRWPVPLMGDTQPALAVNAVYLAPAPGDPWSSDTVYPAGSVVTAVPSNGHYYISTNEARSGTSSPTFTIAKPEQVVDPTPAVTPGPALTWMDVGTGMPPGVAAASIGSWAPTKAFLQGAVIQNPANGHFYVATVGGFSGPVMPVFPINSWGSVSETASRIQWREIGPAPAPTTPPTPTGPAFWTPNTPFSVGQVINGLNNHFYVAITAGQSGARIPNFSTTSGAVTPDSQSNLPQLSWTDLGTGSPIGLPATALLAWAPGKLFSQGSVILYPNNGHYYGASVGGVSGAAAPKFPVTPGATVAEPQTTGVIWEDVGATAPAGSPTSLPQWTPSTYFTTGQVISDADNGRFYLARVGGLSGTTMPNFPITKKTPGNGLVSDGDVLWLDSGAATPASVASAGPTDQVLNLLNSGPLPQVHSLYYFNIATGFAVNSNRNPSFVWTSTPPATGFAPGTTQKVGGTLPAEPILLFTTYLPGLALDAESPWKPKNLIPGVSFGFSLSNPANSFYIGGSSEIWRNLQIAAGLNYSKINVLAPGIQEQTSSNTPSTIQHFKGGAFVGVTLNINFIAGLFGAHI